MRKFARGGDLSIITYGGTLGQSLDAARIVEKEDGLAVEVLALRTLLPLDREAILATARKTGKVLVVHEDRLTGGFGGEVSAIIMENAFDYLDGPVRGWRRPIRIRRSARRSKNSSCRTPTRSSTRSATWRRIEMAIDVTMPQMGESVVEGTDRKWLVKEGDVVNEDQPLVEISTDKVDTEIPSPGAGVIREDCRERRPDAAGRRDARGDRSGRRRYRSKTVSGRIGASRREHPLPRLNHLRCDRCVVHPPRRRQPPRRHFPSRTGPRPVPVRLQRLRQPHRQP